MHGEDAREALQAFLGFSEGEAYVVKVDTHNAAVRDEISFAETAKDTRRLDGREARDFHLVCGGFTAAVGFTHCVNLSPPTPRLHAVEIITGRDLIGLAFGLHRGEKRKRLSKE